MDFLTAAVAGDMGHDLDAAMAAAADDGASFTMHQVSAPSGASVKFNSHHRPRPRSDTLDSMASSINSAKLEFPQRRPRSDTLEIYSNMASTSRARSDTVDFLTGADENRARSYTVDFLIGDGDDPMGNIDDVVTLPEENGDEITHNSNVHDHLKALCDEPKISGGKAARILRRKRSDMTDDPASTRAKPPEEGGPTAKKPRKNSEATWKTNISQDSFMNSLNRNRIESWGGMSELSFGGMASSAMATHTALKDTGILDDILAAAADLGGEDSSEGVGSLERIRPNHAAGGGSNSLSGGPAAATQKEKRRPRADSLKLSRRARTDSLESLSLASLSDTSMSIAGPKDIYNSKADTKASVGTPSITVDYDAIAAAVHAAAAATDGLDLAAILGTPTSADVSKMNQKDKSAKRTQNPNMPPKVQLAAPFRKYVRQSATKPLPRTTQQLQKAMPETTISGQAKSQSPFPVTSINIPLVPIPKSTKTKEEMDAIRARARAAAGYVPPVGGGKPPAKIPPPKSIRTTPSLAASRFNPHLNPPYHPGTNIPMKKRGGPPNTYAQMPERIQSNAQPPLSYINPAQTSLSYIKPAQTPSSTLQSQQKWDDMFECLVNFIEVTREKSTKPLNDQQKATWIWDGNVPTSYKTPCGKALGRWINNQRSAKAKGTLKDDREVRLVSTGLKWSVLTTNSWRQMLRELEIYVNEQTKNGRMWDGNVPTNYKIKSNIPAVGADPDEEKNLGRWVNRQRSLFQGGKLKKDRQNDLERIGLKWSVLLTTSWSSMYESLCAYAEEKRTQSPHGVWDGNVPANFKTRSNPPLSLGRWVNRQRSAHAKGRLKDEYVKKLEVVGLKWVIHTRHKPNEDDDDDFVGGEFIQSNLLINTIAAPASNATALLNGKSAQGSSIVLPSLPPLPPLGNAISNNGQAPR